MNREMNFTIQIAQTSRAMHHNFMALIHRLDPRYLQGKHGTFKKLSFFIIYLKMRYTAGTSKGNLSIGFLQGLIIRGSPSFEFVSLL